MFCPDCGKEVPEDARFCGYCRFEMKAARAQAQAGSAKSHGAHAGVADKTVSIPAVGSEISDLLKWGILACAVLLPIVPIIMGVIYLSQGGEAKKNVGLLWLGAGILMAILYAMSAGL